MKARIILSKYESVCPQCGTRIRIGDTVRYERGRPTVHHDCRGRAESAAKAQAALRAPKDTGWH